MSPSYHAQLLSEYLKLAPHLEIPSTHRFSRPVLRHPDLSPNNILVNSSSDIVGIIDWQNAVILPLGLCAGIPDHFQNWGDHVSETLKKPVLQLPENFDKLSQDEQDSIRETMRKRLVHFYYAALTMKHMPDHFDALRNENAMLRVKLFSCAGAPWEGDSLSLKYALLQVHQNWPTSLGRDDTTESAPCPVQFTEEESRQCVDKREQEQEKLQELSEMKDVIGIDALGWVPDDEQLEKSKRIAEAIKEGLLAHSENEMERAALSAHFPFDDHDEDA
ncbi:uncharacterized protein TRUGW13939_08123 [Talaromyces rugulosus]|uniref:Aminoglycoside phosphotransferase domain-containing protein n=1 Tax=Talaromyces rugulosus TaxID=121627 RepID=A0A7H8R439_TALRU|nr:uncharacterized protein TRUGW13939_08123 [Talaromyces rugulosus]QKX60977.1 hypothetical protein TRUGW13939_08123 [Talaromyces rugulosus]